MAAIERLFQLSDHGTDVRTEMLAGLTTFLTMAYIIFVQPAVLSTDLAGKPTGLDFGAVLLATCLASALASIFMASTRATRSRWLPGWARTSSSSPW